MKEGDVAGVHACQSDAFKNYFFGYGILYLYFISKMKHFSKHALGFTLIELIVVIGIMGTVAVMGAQGFNTQNARQQLKRDAELLADSINLARSRASAQDVENQAGCTLARYNLTLRITATAQSFEVWRICTASSQQISSSNFTNTRYVSPISTAGTWEIGFLTRTGQLVTMVNNVPVPIVTTQTIRLRRTNNATQCIEVRIPALAPASVGDLISC